MRSSRQSGCYLTLEGRGVRREHRVRGPLKMVLADDQNAKLRVRHPSRLCMGLIQTRRHGQGRGVQQLAARGLHIGQARRQGTECVVQQRCRYGVLVAGGREVLLVRGGLRYSSQVQALRGKGGRRPRKSCRGNRRLFANQRQRHAANGTAFVDLEPNDQHTFGRTLRTRHPPFILCHKNTLYLM